MTKLGPALSLAFLASLPACSPDSGSAVRDGGSSAGGESGASGTSGGATGTGGTPSGSGGSGTVQAGGTTASGGASATGGKVSSGGAAGGNVSTGGTAGGPASAECTKYCDCMAANCADKVFPDGCLKGCAAQKNWDMPCRQNMCQLVPPQPANDHCTHAFGVGQCLDL